MNSSHNSLRYRLNKFFGVLAIVLSIFVIVFFGLALTVGWWADYDGVQQEWEISGKIKIQKIENYGFDLVFYRSRTGISGITGDCRVVYYDSLHNNIFAEGNKYSHEFYIIHINDPNNSNKEQALNISEITAAEYNASINNKMKKWDISSFDN